MEGQLAATPNTNSIHDANHALDGPLLPENVACMVTAASFTARLSLRCSSIFLDALFEAAKYGTVLSLGLSRNALTNALSTAKNIHDTSPKSICSSAITEQEERNGLFVQLLEKYTDIGLHIVSHTFSLAELFAISGLQFTSRTIQSSLKVAEESVRIIDGIFGSNDTSRAIASIITLVHRELVQDPEFGLAKAGKIAILAGLTKALTAFAVLQNVTHKRMMKHIPMTVLWEGLVTDEKEDQIKQNNSLIQFKNKTHCNENRLILQRLLNKEEQESDALVCDNHAYKVAAETTCLTTKTISIGSSHLKKITVNTNQEKNAAYLAMLYQNSRLLLSALTERQYRRKIERPDNQVYHHQRRFSSPGDYSEKIKLSQQ
ncbi:hypothetical protein CU098_004451 [Rhizopus stolonifer]|uniref:Uncharacterized protein n=1 Tax=Rhizopus stolonifer TaxID=4846 RepID=A0A367KPZ3_RHIST|nr:hypothetical protein CU098_004451 [Rhizopus stolonifer]